MIQTERVDFLMIRFVVITQTTFITNAAALHDE